MQAESADQVASRARPTGISMIALLAGAIGLWNCVVSYSILWAGGWASWVSLWTGQPPTTVPPSYEAMGAGAVWLGFVLPAVAIATVVGAGGLWLMSRWAWWLTVGGLAIGLVTDVFAAFG